jgi:anthranilate synthase component I
MLADSLLVFDQVKRQITAVAYADLSGGADPEQAYAAACARIAQPWRSACTAPAGQGSHPCAGTTPGVRDRQRLHPAATQPGRFRSRRDPAREHIAAGDVFQLVLSQRLETRIERDPFELYRSLRMVNPSPYMAFFNFGGWYLIGSSPEVMVKADPPQMAASRPPCGRSPAPGPAAPMRPKTKPWRPTCWPIPRNGPST